MTSPHTVPHLQRKTKPPPEGSSTALGSRTFAQDPAALSLESTRAEMESNTEALARHRGLCGHAATAWLLAIPSEPRSDGTASGVRVGAAAYPRYGTGPAPGLPWHTALHHSERHHAPWPFFYRVGGQDPQHHALATLLTRTLRVMRIQCSPRPEDWPLFDSASFGGVAMDVSAASNACPMPFSPMSGTKCSSSTSPSSTSTPQSTFRNGTQAGSAHRNGNAAALRPNPQTRSLRGKGPGLQTVGPRIAANLHCWWSRKCLAWSVPRALHSSTSSHRASATELLYTFTTGGRGSRAPPACYIRRPQRRGISARYVVHP